MQPDYIDESIGVIMAFSGGAALFLIILNSILYGVNEGRDAPYVKQMIACLIAITVFVLSGIAKLFR